MSAVDTETRLADALRVLLPFAVTDEPEWLPERDLAARRVAYAMAALALADHDERRSAVEGTAPPAPITHMLPGPEPDAMLLAA